MWKNCRDAKAGYGKVDPESIDQVRDYCERREYDDKRKKSTLWQRHCPAS